jgi:hypothetical protein
MPEPAEGRHGRADETILAALGEYPFSSVREASRITCLPRFIVY